TRGWRGPTTRSLEALARIACDIYYFRNFSLLLDLKILLRTVAMELRGAIRPPTSGSDAGSFSEARAAAQRHGDRPEQYLQVKQQAEIPD
ncbi:hypothetical protein ACC870_37410, partial [Rhizobium ruizarguesonis]